jgi:beta-glucosidase
LESKVILVVVIRYRRRHGSITPRIGVPTRAYWLEQAPQYRFGGAGLAERSLVLLEDDGILPLRPDLTRVAVIGPIAASARELLGD